MPAALADEAEDPDTEVAKRHFASGSAFYDKSDYVAALIEFAAARRVLALPAIDYNIARCYDRLEKYSEAIEFYKRYLDGAPISADADETRQRIDLLTKRMNELPLHGVAVPVTPAAPLAPATVVVPVPAPAAPVLVAAPAPVAQEREGGHRGWAIAGGVIGGVVLVGGVVAIGVGVASAHNGDQGITPTELGVISATP